MDIMDSYVRLSSTPTFLVNWYRAGHRTLPWRESPTLYHVWISEIMLQQTRVQAVIPYYERFFISFPRRSRTGPSTGGRAAQSLGRAGILFPRTQSAKSRPIGLRTPWRFLSNHLRRMAFPAGRRALHGWSGLFYCPGPSRPGGGRKCSAGLFPGCWRWKKISQRHR